MMLQITQQIQLVQAVSSVVLAGFTVVLAWATWRYYHQSKLQTEEMKQARKEEIRPVIKPAVVNKTGLHHAFVVVNTGNGAAHDIKGSWGFEHLNHEVEWKTAIIPAGERHVFSLPFGENSELLMTAGQIEAALDEVEGSLTFEADYTDPMERSYRTEETLDVLDTVGQGAGFEIVQKDELKQTRKEIEKLRKETRKQRRAIKKISRWVMNRDANRANIESDTRMSEEETNQNQ